MNNKPKIIPYLLLAGVLVLAIVFFVQSQGTDQVEEITPQQMTESVPLEDGMYTVVTEEGEVRWFGAKKIVNSSHTGEVQLADGEMIVEEGMVTGGEIIVDMKSITLDPDDNGGEQLINHLKSDDFFSVETYPTARLVVTDGDITEQGLNITADLTIKEATHPVTINATVTETEAGTLLVGDFSFDRALYDVRFGSESFFSNLGDAAIKDQVDISFSLAITPEE